MRQLALVILGFLLLALDGALCRVFHLEWMHPDPILLLNVFVALHLASIEGAVMVCVLGIVADSFAGTPPGMLASSHLLIWLLVRWFKQVLLLHQRMAKLGILLVMSLVYSLLTILQLVVMEMNSGPIWISLKAMFPLGVLHMLLAVPIWGLAKRILPPPSHLRAIGVW